MAIRTHKRNVDAFYTIYHCTFRVKRKPPASIARIACFFFVLSLSVAMIRAMMRRGGTDLRGHMRDLQILSTDMVAVVFEWNQIEF